MVLFLALGCGRSQVYELHGQIVAIDPARREVTIRHDDIRGFMPGMTMPFKVKDERLIQGRTPGDLVRARLVVEEATPYLVTLEATGHAPLGDIATPARRNALEPGEQVPDAAFIDQSGASVRLSSWDGQTRAVTFMYTRCPVPDFCPLMDRHFSALQREIVGNPVLSGRVRLISVSIDPAFDTPGVLRAHATRVGAEPTIWSLVTGGREEIERFASSLGVAIMRDDPTAREVVHNLRTAVLDPDRRLVKVFGGNEWTPEQVLAELKRVAAR